MRRNSIQRNAWILLLVFVLTGVASNRITWAEGENIVLVVNASSPDSLAIANHYVHLRQIPATNVIYVDQLPILTKIDRESSASKHYKSKIITPVLQAINKRGLNGQIDYIVFSAGFPTRINFSPQMKIYLKQAGLKYDIHFHAPWASLTSLTYFHENAFSANPDFLKLDANWYASQQTKGILNNPFSGQMASSFDSARSQFEQRNYKDASRLFSQLVQQNPEQAVVHYFLARSFVSDGETSKAIDQLKLCMEQGWCYRSVVEKDPSFAALKNDDSFKKILDEMLELPVKHRLSRGFSSKTSWATNGWPNGPEDQGRRFMLSTMLAVTGKGGSTLEQALAQIESSVSADGSQPEGTFFFAEHKNIRSRVRQYQFDDAAAELISMGYQVDISDKPVPLNNKQIIGATLGSAKVAWKKSKSKFVPGALCDNFTSYGGWWSKAKQTQLTDFLNAGAAGASGTVYEPYTIPPKFPDARLHVHYARGCTLAEAFYQSVNSPFQLLIVGDPLCCPFGKFPKFEVEGLTTRSVVKDNFDLKFIAKTDGPEINHFEFYLDGRFLKSGHADQEFPIETDDMGDGFHEIRVVAVCRSLQATRASQKLDFWLRRDGHKIKINVEKKTVRLGEPLIITATSSSGSEIVIRQNSRVIGKINGDKKLEIDSATLGQGISNLQGFVVVDKKTIASVPVEVEILP